MLNKIDSVIILKFLYCLVFFIIPFGPASDIGQSIFGLSIKITHLVYISIFLLGSYYLTFERKKFYLSNLEIVTYLFFILYLGSYLISLNLQNNFNSSLHVIIISFLIIITANISWEKKSITNMIFIFLIAQTLISFLTIVDYFKLIDLNFLNKSPSANPFFDIANVITATGPFNSRTPFVMYLLLACVSSLFLAMNVDRKLIILLIFSFLINLICGFMTISRSFIIVLLIVLVIYFSLKYKNKSKFLNFYSKEKILFYFLIFIFTITIPLIIFFMSGVFNVEGMPFRPGDMKRVWANLIVLDDIFNSFYPFQSEDKPWVMDFGRVGFHNIFGFIMHKTGLLGCLCFLFMIFNIFNLLTKTHNKDSNFLLVFLILSWLLYGMFHSIINITLLWIIFGFLISNMKFRET